MNKEQLVEYINCGREIEFIYNDKRFSITYGKFNGVRMISFCEFYNETTEVNTVDALFKITRYGVTVLEMWESISEDDVWIY